MGGVGVASRMMQFGVISRMMFWFSSVMVTTAVGPPSS
jgi:hypothetical protein